MNLLVSASGKQLVVEPLRVEIGIKNSAKRQLNLMRHLRSLEKSCAFNSAYRSSWRNYLEQYNRAGIEEKLQLLTGNLDSLSKHVANFQLEIVPYFFPHAIVGELLHTAGIEERLLHPEITQSLRPFGFFGQETEIAKKLQEELSFPEPILQELLVGCGLDFIQETARETIRKRTVIDAGAYIGDSARFFQNRYRAGRIFAIEPDAQNVTHLRELVSEWDAENVIFPIQAATGKENGFMKLWGEGVGTSGIMKAGQEPKQAQVAKMISIDGLVSEQRIKNVSLIKLDVEGAEYDSILGAQQTIKEQRPILIISIYHTAKDFFEIKPLIESWGLGYKFMIRKLTPDLIKEIVLIGYPDKV